MPDVAAPVPSEIAPADAPTPNRRERHVIETRRSIIAAARGLFEAQGYAETTVDQIAAAADVAPRTFFRYFATKETLLFAEFDAVRAEMLARLESSPEDDDPVVSLSAALRWMAAAIEERRDELVWGFRLCATQQVEGVYERTVVKEQSNARIAEFVAERLGVDIEVDPRPVAWTNSIMGVFGAAMKYASLQPDRPGHTVELFDELLASCAIAIDATRTAG